MQVQKMIQVLNAISPLTDQDIETLSSICSSEELPRGECWLKMGKRPNKVGFLIAGYLRKYYLLNEKEVTDFFYFDGDLCADLPALISDIPSHVDIVAMQDSQLISFSFSKFLKLCDQSPHIERLYRTLLEQTFVRFYNRANSFMTKSPRERYEDLIGSNPRILQRATQYHIASFLAISPQHLSRLRGQYSIS